MTAMSELEPQVWLSRLKKNVASHLFKFSSILNLTLILLHQLGNKNAIALRLTYTHDTQNVPK